MTGFTELLAKAKESLKGEEWTINYNSEMGERIEVRRGGVSDRYASIRFEPRNARPWRMQVWGGPHTLPIGRARHLASFEAAVIAAAEALSAVKGASK